MIDPLETVIAYLRQDTRLMELVGTRVSSKRRYGANAAADVAQGAPGWNVGETALTIRMDGGGPDIYAPVQDVRLEVRCYASSQMAAMRVWRRLVELSRGVEREAVDTSAGRALLHNLLQSSGPSTLYDAQIGMDFVLAFFDARVGEELSE